MAGVFEKVTYYKCDLPQDPSPRDMMKLIDRVLIDTPWEEGKQQAEFSSGDEHTLDWHKLAIIREREPDRARLYIADFIQGSSIYVTDRSVSVYDGRDQGMTPIGIVRLQKFVCEMCDIQPALHA